MIDANTGQLKPSPYVEFDREKQPFEDVTVKVGELQVKLAVGIVSVLFFDLILYIFCLVVIHTYYRRGADKPLVEFVKRE